MKAVFKGSKLAYYSFPTFAFVTALCKIFKESRSKNWNRFLVRSHLAGTLDTKSFRLWSLSTASSVWVKSYLIYDAYSSMWEKTESRQLNRCLMTISMWNQNIFDFLSASMHILLACWESILTELSRQSITKTQFSFNGCPILRRWFDNFIRSGTMTCGTYLL